MSILTSIILALRLFTLPTIPEAIEAPADRALYLAEHYWDNTPLSDTLVTNQPDEFEHFLVDYLTILPLLSQEQQDEALRPLFAIATPLLRRYLTGEDSPVAAPDLYRHALVSLVQDLPHIDVHFRFRRNCDTCIQMMEQLDRSSVIRSSQNMQRLILRIHQTSDEPRLLLHSPAGECLSNSITVAELETILQEMQR